MEDEPGVIHRVEPGHAFPVGAGQPVVELGRRGTDVQELAIGAVEVADQVIAAGLRRGGGVATQRIADGVEGRAPAAAGLQLGVEIPLPVVVVEAVGRGEHVNERGRGMQVLLQQQPGWHQERLEMVGPPGVALGVVPGVDPRLARLAVRVEGNVLVAVAGRVGIEIDVIVVQPPGHVITAAKLAECAARRACPAWGRGARCRAAGSRSPSAARRA